MPVRTVTLSAVGSPAAPLDEACVTAERTRGSGQVPGSGCGDGRYGPGEQHPRADARRVDRTGGVSERGGRGRCGEIDTGAPRRPADTLQCRATRVHVDERASRTLRLSQECCRACCQRPELMGTHRHASRAESPRASQRSLQHWAHVIRVSGASTARVERGRGSGRT
jgi:hypothetical protein